MSDETTIEIPVWWKPGNGHMYRRDCLPTSHPESDYNYVKNVLKKNPEDYGIYTDKQRYIMEELKHKTNEELMLMVADMRETILAYERAGF